MVHAMRFSRVVAQALVAVALASLAGCGGSSDLSTAGLKPQDYLLSTHDMASIAGKSSEPEAARAMLGFYRAVQFQDYAGAYRFLSPQLHRQISYEKFVNVVSGARGTFLIKPRLGEVVRSDGLTGLTTFLQRGPVLTRQDQVIIFNMLQRGGQWYIATDPFNLFKVPPPEPTPTRSRP